MNKDRQCKVPGCELPVKAKDLCGAHYQRNRIHGSPLTCTPREDRVIHSHARKGRLTPEYHTWSSMLARCSNPNTKDYANYGGRGISVCERWQDFSNFFADMGSRPSRTHSIDRYPNKDGGYEPNNCRWATPLEQGTNTRRNVWLEFNGKNQTISQWARELGLRAATIRDRVHRYKWPVDLALTAPMYFKLHKPISTGDKI